MHRQVGCNSNLVQGTAQNLAQEHAVARTTAVVEDGHVVTFVFLYYGANRGCVVEVGDEEDGEADGEDE